MAAFTSRSTMRPAGPDPSILERSRSFSLASRRTIGEALNCPLPPAPSPEGAGAPLAAPAAARPEPAPPRRRRGGLAAAPSFAVPARFCFRSAGGFRLAAAFGHLFALASYKGYGPAAGDPLAPRRSATGAGAA